MTKEDLILEQLSYLRGELDNMRSDVAVLKAKHDTGNMSEKVCAGVAVLALLVSLAVAVTSCKEHKDAKNNGRYRIPHPSTVGRSK